MKVYIDTGIFFDYLAEKNLIAQSIRKKSRRGRNRSRLYRDALACLTRLERSHEPITSSLTLFELEHSIFEELARIHKRTSYKKQFIVASARPAVVQGLTVCGIYGVSIMDLTESMVRAQASNIGLQQQGILAADALHISTAIHEDAELILTGDRHLLNLDGSIQNQAGNAIRCMDTNDALALI